MRNGTWTWRPLGELFEIGAGKTMSAAARRGATQTPFLRTSNVLWDEIDLSVVDTMAILPHELAGKLVRSGDLLVCEGGEIGRAAIWNGEVETMSFQNHLHRLRPTIDEVEPRFYVYFLQCAFTQLGIFAGAGNKTTIPNLSRSRLAALEVPHPPIDEQRAIVRALAWVRSAIGTHGQASAVAHELKRAALRELFTRGLRNEPQKRSEIGPTPESWNPIRVGDIGEIVTGTTPKTSERQYYDGGNVPFVSPADLGDGTAIKTTEKFITEKGLSVSRALPSWTTCFVCIGSSIGKIGITSWSKCASNQQINALIPTQSFDQKYVCYLLSYWSAYISSFASPSPVPILSKGSFSNIVIYTTLDRDEQARIGNLLWIIDQKIDVLRHKRCVLNELFGFLLQQLMTGEVNVVNLDMDQLNLATSGDSDWNPIQHESPAVALP